MEAECRLWIGNINAIFNYIYCDSKDDDGFPLAYAPEHIFNTRLYYNMRNISLGTMLYIEHAQNRYYKHRSGYKGKLDDYTLVNFSINKSINGNITAFMRIENLLNQQFDIYEDGKSLAGYGRSMLGGIRFEY
jgi:outer membrane receptor for ferrienterochelin and colicin